MDAGKVEHKTETAHVKLLEDRRGWFWPTPLLAGEEYELPVDVADYLVGLGVAVEAKAEAKTPKGKAG